VTANARIRRPSQARALRTRKALLEAGAAEFSTRGYAGTTAKTIAERAGTATGSFYQYFENKDVLLRELVAERQGRLAEATVAVLERASAESQGAPPAPARVRASMRRIVEVVIAAHREDPGFHAVFTERRHADPELDALVSAGEREIQERTARLLERWGYPGDAQAAAFVLFGALEGTVHAHVLGRPLVGDERLVTALVDALIEIAVPPSLFQETS